MLFSRESGVSADEGGTRPNREGRAADFLLFCIRFNCNLHPNSVVARVLALYLRSVARCFASR